jgi:hypothetical protein
MPGGMSHASGTLEKLFRPGPPAGILQHHHVSHGIKTVTGVAKLNRDRPGHRDRDCR